MPERIGYEFTVDDRQLLQALARFESGLEDLRAESRKLRVDTGKAFASISGDIDRSSKKVSQFGSVFGGIIAADLVREGVRGTRQLLTGAVDAAKGYEQLEVSFTTFLGSAEKADKLLDQLTETAARTPFQQDEIFNGARQLLAFGFEAERVNDLLIDLGNISSGIGQPLSRLTLIFGQIQAKGKLAGQELLQLREAGVNPIAELAEVLGVAQNEIEGLVSKGKVSSEAVAAAFKLMSSEGGRFANLMEKQSETFEGVTSNFRDQVSIILREFGTGLLPTLKEGVKDMLAFLQTLDVDRIRSFASNIGEAVRVIVSFVKAFGPVVAGYLAATIAIKAVTAAQRVFNTVSKANPWALVVQGVGAALPILTTYIKRLSGVSKAQEEVEKTAKSLKREFISEAIEVQKNIDVLRSLESTQRERQAAIEDLNRAYPDILAKYDLEKGLLTDLIDLNEELRDAIAKRLVQEKTADAQRDLFEQLERIKGADFTRTEAASTDERALEIQADLIEKANAEYDERIKLIEEVGDLLPSIITGEEKATTTQEQRNALLGKETKIREGLNKLTTDQLNAALRGQGSLVLTNEYVRKIAAEIVQERKKEVDANQQNKKEIEEAAKRLEKYQEAIRKVAENIRKADIGLITDPFEKLVAERQLSLDQSAELFKELEEQAREAARSEEERKKALAELTELQSQAQRQIWIQYYRDLQELRKEDAEDALEKFLRARELSSAQSVDTLQGSVQSDGVNTRDELLRVKILEQELKDIEEAGQALIFAGKANSDEVEQLFLDRNEKLRQIEAARSENAAAALGREEQQLLAEVDLIQRSTDITLTLEEFKEKKRLEIQLKFARRRLEDAKKDSGENSPEVKALKSTIAAMENAIANFTPEQSFEEKVKSFIAGLFKIDAKDQEFFFSQIGNLYQNINNLISQSTEHQIDENERILDSLRNRISETESELQKEIEAQEAGFAANVESKKKELEALRIEERKHQQELANLRKAQLKQKLLQDTASQLSSVATMVYNITQAESSKGLLGLLTAAVAISGFLAIIKSFKAQAQAAVQEPATLFKGGRIPMGRTDERGGRGHRIEDTNIRVGGDEWVLNKPVSDRHHDFIKDLNEGRYDHLNLHHILKDSRKLPYRIKGMQLSKELATRVDKQQERAITIKHQHSDRVMREVFGEVMTQHADRLIQHMDQQEQVVPLVKNGKQVGITIKKKGFTRNRKFT